MKPIPYKQTTSYSCGPACMKMLLSALGITKSEAYLIKVLKANHTLGTSSKNFPKYVSKRGIEWVRHYGMTPQDSIKTLKRLSKFYTMMICFYDRRSKEGHYAVVKRVGSRYIHLLDPAYGSNVKINLATFKQLWSTEYFGKETCWMFGIK